MSQQGDTSDGFPVRLSRNPLSRTLHSLQHRNWRLLWLAGNFWHLYWMDLLVLTWLVLVLTDSPFRVSLVGAFRMLPLVFAPFLGSLGDRFPKRNLLIVAQLVNISATVGLAVVLLLDVVQLWHIYLVASLTGCTYAADFPIRQAFIRDLVPESSIVNAMSLDTASRAAMSMFGRFLGGGLLALAGASGAYVFLSACYILGLVLLLRVPNVAAPITTGIRPESVAKGLMEALRYALGNPVLRALLIVTVLMNALVFSYIQLTPVFARDVLKVGPALLGLMTGMEGAGFLLGAVALASFRNVRRLGFIFLLGGLTSGIAVLLFSQSTVYSLSAILLFFAGIGLGGYIVAQHVIAVSVPPEIRARVMGVVALAIIGQPLGTIYVGFLADHLGAPAAVGINSLACSILVFAVMVFQPELRRFSSWGK